MGSRAIFGIVAILLLGAFLLLNSLFRVTQVEQALVVELGKPVRQVAEPGLHFKKPFIQDVAFFDNRLLEFNAEPRNIILKDQKRLIVDSYVRYRITDPLKFFQTVRNERNMEDRLNSIVESSLRQVMGGQLMKNVLSSDRAEIMHHITAVVNSQASGKPLPKEVAEELDGTAEVDVEEIAEPAVTGGFGIEVVDVRVKRADQPPENREATFRRMIAEREREAKEFRATGEEEAQKIRARAENEKTIMLAKAKRQSDILRGEGEAKATKIFAEAFGRDTDFFEFMRSMQAYEKVLTDNDTSMVLSPDSTFLKFIEKQ